MSRGGDRATIALRKSPPRPLATLIVPPSVEFALAAISLVRREDWKDDYLTFVPVCVRKDGACVGIEYPLPAASILTPAASGANVNQSIAGDTLPFDISAADKVRVMSLDDVVSWKAMTAAAAAAAAAVGVHTSSMQVDVAQFQQSTVDISGVVPQAGAYVFMRVFNYTKNSC